MNNSDTKNSSDTNNNKNNTNNKFELFTDSTQNQSSSNPPESPFKKVEVFWQSENKISFLSKQLNKQLYNSTQLPSINKEEQIRKTSQ
jgi:hypothetical protein